MGDSDTPHVGREGKRFGVRTIIAGSREFNCGLITLRDAVAASGFTITEVVSGGARGVDQIGETWASLHSLPIKRFRPDWKYFGKKAGPIRNREMAEYAEALIALWDGESRGTRNMIEEAEKRGLKVYVHKVEIDPDR